MSGNQVNTTKIAYKLGFTVLTLLHSFLFDVILQRNLNTNLQSLLKKYLAA